jgi:hypothetical protein
MTTAQAVVLNTLKQHGPLPDHALVPIVQHVTGAHMSSSGIRTRRDELVKSGHVKCVDSIKMPSGRMASVWDAA